MDSYLFRCVRCLLELEQLKLINENRATANDIDGNDGEYAGDE
jgi:hypothetical protein